MNNDMDKLEFFSEKENSMLTVSTIHDADVSSCDVNVSGWSKGGWSNDSGW